jgi:hypothetical protein
VLGFTKKSFVFVFAFPSIARPSLASTLPCRPALATGKPAVGWLDVGGCLKAYFTTTIQNMDVSTYLVARCQPASQPASQPVSRPLWFPLSRGRIIDGR